MSVAQYWDDDCTLTTFYRKADELKSERKNQEMWLQGAYIYDALCRVSPLLHAFAKKGSKPSPYPAEPYTFNEKQQELREVKKKKDTFIHAKDKMERFMQQHNKKFEGK